MEWLRRERGGERAILKSIVVQIPINRAFDEAYSIISKPENYRLWSPIPDARIEPRGNDGRDWLVELPTGLFILRFSANNDYGVLDYTLSSEDGSVSRTTPARLIRNEDGCELVVVFFQQPGQTDEVFASRVEWARNDYMALKAVVETL